MASWFPNSHHGLHSPDTAWLLAGCEASAAPPSEVPLTADASEPTTTPVNDRAAHSILPGIEECAAQMGV